MRLRSSLKYILKWTNKKISKKLKIRTENETFFVELATITSLIFFHFSFFPKVFCLIIFHSFHSRISFQLGQKSQFNSNPIKSYSLFCPWKCTTSIPVTGELSKKTTNRWWLPLAHEYFSLQSSFCLKLFRKNKVCTFVHRIIEWPFQGNQPTILFVFFVSSFSGQFVKTWKCSHEIWGSHFGEQTCSKVFDHGTLKVLFNSR